MQLARAQKARMRRSGPEARSVNSLHSARNSSHLDLAQKAGIATVPRPQSAARGWNRWPVQRNHPGTAPSKKGIPPQGSQIPSGQRTRVHGIEDAQATGQKPAIRPSRFEKRNSRTEHRGVPVCTERTQVRISCPICRYGVGESCSPPEEGAAVAIRSRGTDLARNRTKSPAYDVSSNVSRGPVS